MRLLADVIIPDQHFGLVSEVAPGSEAFVLFTLGLLAFLFGAFTAAAYVLWRREKHPAPHRRLLMELDEDHPLPPPKTAGHDDESGAQQPWERKADWWKQ